MDLSKAQAEELPTFIFGGGPKQADTPPSQCTSFCQRTKRMLVPEIGDGHCGAEADFRAPNNDEENILFASRYPTNQKTLMFCESQCPGISGLLESEIVIRRIETKRITIFFRST